MDFEFFFNFVFTLVVIYVLSINYLSGYKESPSELIL